MESAWRGQLGEGLQTRAPQNRFLMLTISITNRGSAEASIPLLKLDIVDGPKIPGTKRGRGHYGTGFGIIRKVAPGQTMQGRVAFDVPLSVFKLELPESSESGYDKFTLVEIPLRIDSDCGYSRPCLGICQAATPNSHFCKEVSKVARVLRFIALAVMAKMQFLLRHRLRNSPSSGSRWLPTKMAPRTSLATNIFPEKPFG